MEIKAEFKKWFLFALTGIVCGVSGYFYGDNSVRKDAVKHNVARWVADENGSPKFGWGQ